MENVTGLMAKKNEKALQSIIRLFNKLGYNIDVNILSAQHFGVPEKRKRTIFIGSKVNNKITFPEVTHFDSPKLKNTPTYKQLETLYLTFQQKMDLFITMILIWRR